MHSSAMAKRLRLRFARVFPSFQGLRSKGGAAPPSAMISDAGFDVDFVLSSPPDRPHAPLVSTGCCRPSRRRSSSADLPPPPTETPAYLWRKEEKWWHVVACSDADADADNEGEQPFTPRQKIDSDDGIFPPLVLRRGRRRKVASRRRSSLLRRQPRGGSKYSSADDEDSGWFSSDEEATTTLISTTDVESSDNVLRRRRRNCGMRSWKSGQGWAAVERLIPCAAPAVRESFAVVKLSEDPMDDFRRSMAEMVVEKEIFDAAGLEQLLRCFLSLNSRHHHAAIVAAFRDIWDALFPAETVPGAGRRCSSPRSVIW
ncbi:hypothetical protein Cni_G26423 [Canna indica]|uniref:Transcription repressor n=1 Tax=Canna indica TaxID=4628 RepID=A0AAQ3KZQ0_9LILI|nr:hypothetical protein Cni_G26423 [Canna indica]